MVPSPSSLVEPPAHDGRGADPRKGGEVSSRAAADRVELALTGMTCAACAARIEKSLNRLPGVEADVNFATESARVAFDASRSRVDDLLAAVSRAGYGGRVKHDSVAERAAGEARRLAAYRALRFEFLVACALSPVSYTHLTLPTILLV